jgi:hypothetical protein
MSTANRTRLSFFGLSDPKTNLSSVLRSPTVVVAAAAPAPAMSCRQGEFNNQQGREAATEGLGWAQTGGR